MCAAVLRGRGNNDAALSARLTYVVVLRALLYVLFLILSPQVLLGPGNLYTKKRWFRRARLWRFVLLVNPAGYFDPTPGLAMALLAQRVLPKDVKHLLRKKAGTLESLLVLAATDGEVDEAPDDVIGQITKEDAFCPATGFDWTAIEWCMPKRLRKLQEEYEAEGLEVPVLRFWVRAYPALLLHRGVNARRRSCSNGRRQQLEAFMLSCVPPAIPALTAPAAAASHSPALSSVSALPYFSPPPFVLPSPFLRGHAGGRRACSALAQCGAWMRASSSRRASATALRRPSLTE